MRTSFLASVLLVGVLTVGGPVACAQGQAKADSGFRVTSADLALTFTTEESNVLPGSNNNFWMRGGSFDAGVTFFHGLGAAVNFTGLHAGNISPNINLDEIALMAGPRYTFHLGGKYPNRLFVESLFGGVHARDGIFPTATGVTPAAGSFSLQVGGGWDVTVWKDLAVRVFEADWVRTSLPNGASNVQDHLRLAFGVSYHIGKH